MLTKKIFVVLLSIFAINNYCLGQTIIRLNNSRISARELDTKIQALMQAAHVQGLAVAVFNNDRPVYKRTFGYKRFNTKEPLTSATNLYGASLSKAVFAVMVMKFVERGLLNLDKPLQSYLPKPIYEYAATKKWHDNYSDLKTDTLYSRITARMCLDHTSGFPNWRWFNADQKLKVNGVPGSRYSYSGEGMVYLQVVLEHLFGKPLEEMMTEEIFRPLGMKQSSYTWQPRFENDYAFGHQSDGTIYEKDKDNEARSASTLETTLDDYVLFLTGVLNYKLLSRRTTDQMFSPQIRIRSMAQFGPLHLKDSTLNDAIQLGYGLGWVLLQSPYGRAAFKEGHGDGFQHYSILFPSQHKGILLMSNSDNAEGIFKELLQTALGDTYTPWQWENYVPYNGVK